MKPLRFEKTPGNLKRNPYLCMILQIIFLNGNLRDQNFITVHSQIFQNAQIRVDLAFKAFWKRCKQGQKPGFPRFKGKGWYDSITYPQSGFRLHPDGVYLSKIDRVKVVLHRPIEGKIKTCTVKRTPTGKWYVYFSCIIETARSSSKNR